MNNTHFTVPKMPAIPPADKLAPPQENWLLEHCMEPDESLRQTTASQRQPKNLSVDVFFSLRSPYSYLVLDRLLYLHSVFDVDVTIKVIFPIAVRVPQAFSQLSKILWYKWPDLVHDSQRTAACYGLPFKYPNPDPIVQDAFPAGHATMAIAPIEQQPYIAWLVRLASAAQLAGKSLAFAHRIMHLIWSGESSFWPQDIEFAINSIGLDYQGIIADIQNSPQRFDAVWQANQTQQLASGHGGVPNMVFNGEPFFGQDRFSLLLWRLEQHGLKKRERAKAPFIEQPSPWPA